MHFLGRLSRTVLFVLLSSAFCLAQQTPQAQQDRRTLDLSFGYNYVHANAPPASCGCFSMQGGSASIGLPLPHRFTAVADFGATHAENINNSTEDLTLFTYLFGVRYAPKRLQSRHISPFAEAMFGAAHTYSQFPLVNGGNGIAAMTGGGLDIRLNRRISIRAFDADYLFTHIPNGANDSQNNLRITSGLVLHLP
jgi:peptidoglycan-associated lipoprotein